MLRYNVGMRVCMGILKLWDDPGRLHRGKSLKKEVKEGNWAW